MAPSIVQAASALLLATASSALAQFVPAPTDLQTSHGYLDLPVRWKEVPAGTCELTPGVKSYSGYVDIAEDEHIFFWFFEARNSDPQEAELTVWINGGPGASSMLGLFQELGPCGVDSDGKLYNNPYSWNNVSNLLFIDQPAQTGLSYSKPVPAFVSGTGNIVQLPNNTCPEYAQYLGTCGTYSLPNVTDTANSTNAAAPGMWKTLQGFMGAFPQYSRGSFHFGTESYGGHYGPVFNAYIESQNSLIQQGKLPGAHHIDLQTLLVGNGWYDPLINYAAYYNYTVFPGNTYDFAPFNKSAQEQLYNAMYGPGNCYDQTVYCRSSGLDDVCATADAFCASEVEYLLDRVTGRDEYDVRELNPDNFPYNFFVNYLNTPEVQAAIGAFTNFSSSSITVGNAFTNTGDDDREVDTVEDLRSLVAKGVYVVMYAGDADYNCNWLGSQEIARLIDAPSFSSAGFTDFKLPTPGPAQGQVKQSSNYAFMRVYYSGHEVPFYQPALALAMLDRAINGRDLATGTRHVARGCGYVTSGPAESTFREGNATIQYSVLPSSATYNVTLHEPQPGTGATATMVKRSRKPFKPTQSRRVM